MTDAKGHLGTPAPAPARVFVGREDERAGIEAWLLDPYAVPVLAVAGVGGSGKSALLAQVLQGRASWTDLSDAEAVVPSSLAGIAVLDDWDRHLHHRRVVVERLLDRTGHARVVLAGRQDPRRLLPPEVPVQTLHLHPLPLPAREEWARAQGFTELGRARGLVQAVGGHPLTLSLAIDLLRDRPDLDYRTLRDTAEWGHLLTTVVTRLLDGIDPSLHASLLAAAVVQRLDEPLLVAMLGEKEGADQFEDLAALSVLQPVPGGLSLLDELRRPLVDHLQWRRPDHVRLLQSRALAELDRRIPTATPSRAEQLAVEQGFVLRHAFGFARMPAEDLEPGLVFGQLSPGELRRLLAEGDHDPAGHLSPGERDEVELMLDVPGSFVNAARDSEGRIRGYGVITPLSQRGLAGVPARCRLAYGARALVAAVELDELPEHPDATNLWAYTVGTAPPHDAPVVAGLFWSLTAFLERHVGAQLLFPSEAAVRHFGGGYDFGPLKLTSLEVPKEVLGEALDARFYDLSRSSRAVRMASAFDGVEAPGLVGRAGLAAEMSGIVAAWTDDAHLAKTSVARALVPAASADPATTADQVRSTLAAALRALAPPPSLLWRLQRALVEAGITWLPQDIGAATHPEPLPRTTVQLQGNFAVRRDGHLLELGEGVQAALVKVVAWHSKLDTEEVVEHLWPGVDSEAGRIRLRAALARVRKVAPDLLMRDGDTLRLVPDAAVDAVVFREAAHHAVAALIAAEPEARRLGHAALREYAGELLPTDRAADWAAGPREEHTRTALRLLDALASDLLAEDVETAADLTERAVALDPYDESRYLRIVDALWQQGLLMRARGFAERAVAAAADLELPAHPQLQALLAVRSR